MIFEANHQPISHSGQSPIHDVEERVRNEIISRLKLFSLEYPLKCLGCVKLRGIGRQEEKTQPSFLPYATKCEPSFSPVCGGVVRHDHGLSPGQYVKGLRGLYTTVFHASTTPKVCVGRVAARRNWARPVELQERKRHSYYFCLGVS